MNVVLVIIDALRYAYLGANGNDWIQTPNLDRLAAESWGFTNSYTSSYPTIETNRRTWPVDGTACAPPPVAAGDESKKEGT